jgi:hypothetical protein
MIRRDDNDKMLETNGGKAVAGTEKVLRETAGKERLPAETEKDDQN